MFCSFFHIVIQHFVCMGNNNKVVHIEDKPKKALRSSILLMVCNCIKSRCIKTLDINKQEIRGYRRNADKWR